MSDIDEVWEWMKRRKAELDLEKSANVRDDEAEVEAGNKTSDDGAFYRPAPWKQGAR